MTLEELKNLLTNTVEEIEKYQKRATKASSLRIRNKLNDIRKQAPLVRKALLEADKSGKAME